MSGFYCIVTLFSFQSFIICKKSQSVQKDGPMTCFLVVNRLIRFSFCVIIAFLFSQHFMSVYKARDPDVMSWADTVRSTYIKWPYYWGEDFIYKRTWLSSNYKTTLFYFSSDHSLICKKPKKSTNKGHSVPFWTL